MAAFSVSRRNFGFLMAGAAAAAILPDRRALAANGMVAATFPGSWEDAYRRVLTPLMSAAHYGLTIAPALAQDQLAKIQANPANPAYDTLLMSPGQGAVAISSGLVRKIDPSRLSNWAQLDRSFQGEYGPTVTVEVNGIAYNPDLVPRPKGYRDLFENPAYAGKVSWTGFESNTAVMAYTQLAKIYGKGPGDMDAVFSLFKAHPTHLRNVVDSTNHQMTLFQQGEIAVFMCSTNNVARLKALGMKAEFVHPDTGSPAAPVNLYLTTGAKHVDAAYAYMNAAISKAAQDALKLPPTEMFPTNRQVALPPGISAYVTREQLASLTYPDWSLINRHRAAWMRAFDALVAGS
ncbi:extracellular solute-binding protein [Burkholderia multivorans]|uniref:extracellular solute-binding protein n=1 Tax=Burkholderia multivorans TaxID=87883 RepID=UPI001C274510|nr:extracellular solute-binding protein [Burkholderia multivorans]MBU9376219.1 extracellular solute-binding protein [Burkholderia multivorans]